MNDSEGWCYGWGDPSLGLGLVGRWGILIVDFVRVDGLVFLVAQDSGEVDECLGGLVLWLGGSFAGIGVGWEVGNFDC